jgi:hypothetical protein
MRALSSLASPNGAARGGANQGEAVEWEGEGAKDSVSSEIHSEIRRLRQTASRGEGGGGGGRRGSYGACGGAGYYTDGPSSVEERRAQRRLRSPSPQVRRCWPYP